MLALSGLRYPRLLATAVGERSFGRKRHHIYIYIYKQIYGGPGRLIDIIKESVVLIKHPNDFLASAFHTRPMFRNPKILDLAGLPRYLSSSAG